jgi:hypothetical protein
MLARDLDVPTVKVFMVEGGAQRGEGKLARGE